MQNVGGSWPPRLKNSLSGGGYVELSSFEHGPPTTTDWKSALAAAVAELLYTTVVRLPSPPPPPPRTTCRTAICVEDSLEQLIHGCAARASNDGGGSAAREAAALNRGAVVRRSTELVSALKSSPDRPHLTTNGDFCYCCLLPLGPPVVCLQG